MAGLDGVLQQAFGNITPIADQTVKAYSATSTQLDSLNSANMQLQIHQQQLAVQQQQIQREYASKEADLLVKAFDEKTPKGAIPMYLGAASQLAVRAGKQPYTEDFVERSKLDPELRAQASALLKKMALDQTNPSLQAQYDQTLRKLTTGKLFDAADVDAELQNANKPFISEAGQVQQQGHKLQNSAQLDVFKQNLERDKYLTGNPYAPPGFMDRAVPGAKTALGAPVAFGEMSKQLQPVFTEGSDIPDSLKGASASYNAMAESALKQTKQTEAKAQELKGIQEQIRKGDLTGLTPAQRQQAMDFASAPIEDKASVDKWAPVGLAVGAKLGTASAQLAYGRQQTDKANSAIADLTGEARKATAEMSDFVSEKTRLMKLISKPDVTAGEVNLALRDLATVIDRNQRVANTEAVRMLPLNAWQGIQSKISSVLGDSPGNVSLLPSQVENIKNALGDEGAAKGSAILSKVYDIARSERGYKGSMGAMLSNSGSDLEGMTKKFMTNPKPSIPLLQQMYAPVKSGKEDRDVAIQAAINAGINPFAFARYMDAQETGKKRGK